MGGGKMSMMFTNIRLFSESGELQPVGSVWPVKYKDTFIQDVPTDNAIDCGLHVFGTSNKGFEPSRSVIEEDADSVDPDNRVAIFSQELPLTTPG